MRNIRIRTAVASLASCPQLVNCKINMRRAVTTMLRIITALAHSSNEKDEGSKPSQQYIHLLEIKIE